MIWITSTDLADFAKRIQSHHVIIEFIYKLILATHVKDSIIKIDFPLNEDIQTGGTDGELIIHSGKKTIYIPDGHSIWEFGQTSKLKKKADEDYLKRTTKPEGYNICDTTFIFVTARKYTVKDKWVREKKKLRDGWRDIRFYDAQDLEKWFNEAPAVSSNLSKDDVGKFPKCIKALIRNWEEWRITGSKELNHKIFLANRESQFQYVLNWLKGDIPDPNKKGRLIIKSNSIEEAVAFVSAVIETNNKLEKDLYFSRAIIVNDSDELDMLIDKPSPLIIINNTSNYNCVNYAVSKNHKMIIPILKDNFELNRDIEIENLEEDSFINELLELGFNPKECSEFFINTGGNLNKLKKLLI